MVYVYFPKNESDFLDQENIVKKAIKQLRARGITTKIISDVRKLKAGDGCVFIPYSFPRTFRETILYCNQRKIPVITVHVYSEHFFDCTYNTITRDPYVCMRQILAYFIYNIGPKPKIAYFGMSPNTLVDKAKMNAIYTLYPEMKAEDFYYNDNGFIDCFEKFYEKRNEYDAVICANSYIAIGFMETFRNRDPKTAERLMVISFLNTKISKLYHYPITISAYNEKAIYDAAVSIYRNQKKQPYVLHMNAVLKDKLLVRESTHNMECPSEELMYELTSAQNIENREINYSSKEEKIMDYAQDPYLKLISDVEKLLNSADDIDLKIISMFLSGYKNSEVSEKLFISLPTIQYRSRTMFKALNVSNKEEFIEIMSRYISVERLEKYISDLNDAEYGFGY